MSGGTEKKRQFSLSLLMRIFLGILVVISIGVFANSVMYYNELNREAIALTSALEELTQTRAELIELLGSAEELESLLSDYEECQEILNSGSAEGEALYEYRERLAQIEEMLHSSKNKEYIAKIAKEKLGLYFPDEEIFYNDID